MPPARSPVRSFAAPHGSLRRILRRSAETGRSPVRITIDGSTYWKTRAVDFDGIVRRDIAALASDVPFEIFRVDEAPMVGAAVAATCVQNELSSAC